MIAGRHATRVGGIDALNAELQRSDGTFGARSQQEGSQRDLNVKSANVGSALALARPSKAIYWRRGLSWPFCSHATAARGEPIQFAMS